MHVLSFLIEGGGGITYDHVATHECFSVKSSAGDLI